MVRELIRLTKAELKIENSADEKPANGKWLGGQAEMDMGCTNGTTHTLRVSHIAGLPLQFLPTPNLQAHLKSALRTHLEGRDQLVAAGNERECEGIQDLV